MDEALRGKIPPKRRAKKELLRTHNAHLEKQDPRQNGPRAVKQPVLSEAYPASTRSIRELDIIPLSELRVETRHVGQALVVRVISAPYVSAAAVSVVEDEYASADKVAIYNHSDSSILSSVPEGCIVAVKEPFYRFNGAKDDYMICVDHPSDVLLLRFNDPIIPPTLRESAEQVMLRSAEEWRSAGDQAFIKHDLATAAFCYTEALEVASPDKATIKPGISAKRAGTNLVLGRYDAAMEDALSSRIGTPADWKAYYTAGRAAYGLCDYNLSRRHFESALELNSAAPGLQREYERCLARLREENDGCFDFQEMFKAVSPQHVHLDNASYVTPTYVADSPFHGRGVFASRPIKAGELIFCEKAMFMPNQYEPPQASAALYATMVRQLYDNPSLAETALRLYGGDYRRTGKEGMIVDGAPIVDVFLLENIRLKNCFSCPLSTREDTKPTANSTEMAKGLWPYASHMNHACLANSMRSFIGDMLISRAVRDIEKDEELFQQYVPIKAHCGLRQAQFRQGWGFECQCELCVGEAKASPSNVERRTRLLAQIEKIASKRPPNGPKGMVPDATIRTVDRLAKQLEEEHEPEIYSRLPRLMLIYPNMWLMEAHRGRKNHAKVAVHAMKLLRNFGFFIGPNGDPRDIFKLGNTLSLMTIHVVSAMKSAAEAYRVLGQQELALRCEEAGKFGYRIITGFENDLSVLDEP